MKWTIPATLALLLITATGTQAAPNTLFDLHDVEHGGMGAFSGGGTMFNGEWVPVSGGRGQWIINHNVGIGLGGFTLENLPDVTHAGSAYNMQVDFGGMDLEVFCRPDDVVHYSLYMMIGSGHIRAQSETVNFSTTDRYFSLYPQASVEVNVTRWFRINGGVGYRMAQGVDIVGLDNGDLSGFMTNLTFKFGKF